MDIKWSSLIGLSSRLFSVQSDKWNPKRTQEALHHERLHQLSIIRVKREDEPDKEVEVWIELQLSFTTHVLFSYSRRSRAMIFPFSCLLLREHLKREHQQQRKKWVNSNENKCWGEHFSRVSDHMRSKSDEQQLEDGNDAACGQRISTESATSF